VFKPKPEIQDLLDYDYIPIPEGKRVTDVKVFQTGDQEFVQVWLEDVPPPIENILAHVAINR